VLEDVSAVWYRKPEPVDLAHFDLEPPACEYVEAEFTEVTLGLYALLRGARWINNPFTTRIAHRKMLQLKVAHEVGFKVPATIVTNRAEVALAFACERNEVALKSLGAISVIQDGEDCALQYGIFTRRVAYEELVGVADKIMHMPTLFQEFIEKQSELRVTCVGKEVFACRITPRDGDLTADDYRFDTQNLRHAAVEVPELTSRIHAYMEAMRLNFACFDFLVPANGEPVFAEANCNGQWLWVQERTGQQIGRAIAAELLNTSHGAEVS
jgi:glutathione synthase/RimK-type ligase-like ATP-grasp enzyme